MSAPLRITPAGAGKTNNKIGVFAYNRDHPRRCGENYALNFNALAGVGSPPQVRGKLANENADLSGLGITPAGAGKTNLRYALQHC